MFSFGNNIDIITEMTAILDSLKLDIYQNILHMKTTDSTYTNDTFDIILNNWNFHRI